MTSWFEGKTVLANAAGTWELGEEEEEAGGCKKEEKQLEKIH